MQKLCSDCHYIGEIIKPRYHTYKFPLAGLFLGISANTLKVFLSDELPPYSQLYLVIVTLLIFLIPGSYLLYNDLKSSKSRTNNSSKKSSLIFLIFGIILVLWGILNTIQTLNTLNSLLSQDLNRLAGPLIWIIFGIFTIYFYYVDSITCPNCDKKRTMIPLDSPEAQAIIKKSSPQST